MIKNIVFVFVLLVDCFNALESKFSSLEEKNKIIGGYEVKPNSIPYQISLHEDDVAYCGGAIINERTVISSGSCCFNENLSSLSVLAGEHSLFIDSGFEQRQKVVSVKIHPEYSTFEYNICLLQTQEAFLFNDYVSSVEIPEENMEFEGNGITSGWGLTSLSGVSSNVLRAALVPLLPFEQCKKAYDLENNNDSMMCAGEPDKGLCYGDEGGPLTCDGLLCGIAAWGGNCGRASKPGFYTKTSRVSKWIKENAF